MRRTCCSAVAGWTIVSSLVIIFTLAPRPIMGQDKAPAKAPAVKEATKKNARKARGRLPAFYRKVVDDAQRQKIYGIQKEYAPKVKDLKTRLAKLIQERNEKIAQVLTPEQRKKIEELKAAAKAKRKKAVKARSAVRIKVEQPTEPKPQIP